MGSAPHVSQALLSAAEKLLQERRYQDISARDVAKHANVSPSIIYYYFKSKDGLFFALIEFLFLEFERRLNAITSGLAHSSASPTPALVSLFDDCFYQHAEVLRFLLVELMLRNPGIRTLYHRDLSRRVAEPLNTFMAEAARYGHYGKSVPARYAGVSLASIAMHALIMSPEALETGFGIAAQELRSPEWLASIETQIDRLFGH